MYNLINNHIETIVQNVPLAGHFAEYLWLKTQYQIVDIVENEEFKNRYSNFWRMNQARLSQEYKNHYFTLLQNIRDNQLQQIEDILDTLYQVPIHVNGEHRIQFSFATKLLHIASNNSPIYDSLIKEFFFFSPINSNLQYENKKLQYINQYNFLSSEYNRIIENNLLLDSMNYLRATYDLNELITDIKIIDSIIWAFIKYFKQTNINERNIFYI